MNPSEASKDLMKLLQIQPPMTSNTTNTSSPTSSNIISGEALENSILKQSTIASSSTPNSKVLSSPTNLSLNSPANLANSPPILIQNGSSVGSSFKKQDTSFSLKNTSPSTPSSSAPLPTHPPATPQKGSALKGSSISYVANPENRVAVNFSPITLYDSEVQYYPGKQIATNENYMVYGIKGGPLRVINKYNAKRALIKAHKQGITEIKFARDDINLLISLSFDGRLIVWGVSDKKTEENEEVVGYSVYFYFKPSSIQNTIRYFKNAQWHPTKETSVLVTTNFNEIFLINLQKVRETCTSETKSMNFSPDIEGITTIQTAQQNTINCIAYTKDYFAAGYENGQIAFYSTADNAKILLWSAQEVSSNKKTISSIHFHKTKLNYFIVGLNYNTEFLLCKLTQSTAQTSVTVLQSLTLCPNPVQPEEFMNHAEVDSSSQFFLVANMKTPALFVIHILEHDGTLSFDYISEFNTMDPILSFASMTKITDEANNALIMGLFCVQTKSMQLIHVSNDQCYPLELNKENKSTQDEEEDENDKQESEEDANATASNFEPVSDEDSETQQETTTQPAAQSKNISVTSLVKTDNALKPEISKPADFNTSEAMLEKFANVCFSKAFEKYEEERLERLKIERQNQEELIMTISKTLATDIPDTLDQIIQSAVKSKVMPHLSQTITQYLDTKLPAIVQDTVKKSADQAMNKVVKSMNDSVEKVVEKNLKDALSHAVDVNIKQQVSESFQTVLKSTVIPSFETSCQKMFEQIGKAFERGLEDSIKQPMKDFYSKLNNQTVQTIENQLKGISNEIRTSFQNTGAVGSSTPKKQVKEKKKSPEETIQQLLKENNYEAAFTKALSASDLEIVTWLCKKVDPDALQSMSPYPLSQAVILSLIQQLAYDLATETDLKLNWLQKVALNLNHSDPQIGIHIPAIVGQVLKNLNDSFPKLPEKAFAMKLLMHVFNSILKEAS